MLVIDVLAPNRHQAIIRYHIHSPVTVVSHGSYYATCIWWFSARLQYLHCISNGDIAVLHKTIDKLQLLNKSCWICSILPYSQCTEMIRSNPFVTQSIAAQFHLQGSTHRIAWQPRTSKTTSQASKVFFDQENAEFWRLSKYKILNTLSPDL